MRSLTILVAIFVAVAASGFDSSRWIEVNGGDWRPEASLLPEVEALLKPAVASAAKDRGRLPDWSHYTFQFQGRASFLGARYIYVNAFCHPETVELSKHWVDVFDGGACYFSAKFDPKTRRVFDVSVNGVS